MGTGGVTLVSNGGGCGIFPLRRWYGPRLYSRRSGRPRRSLSGIGIVASTLRAVLIPALTAAMLVFVLRLRSNGRTANLPKHFVRLFWVGPTAVWLAGDSLLGCHPDGDPYRFRSCRRLALLGRLRPGSRLDRTSPPIIFPLFASLADSFCNRRRAFEPIQSGHLLCRHRDQLHVSPLFPSHRSLDPAADPPFESHPNDLARFSDHRAGQQESAQHSLFWRPPPKSLETKGSPVTQTFRTPDKRPIQMEARQNLGIHIDLSCCRNVQIVVRNRDPFAHTVGLELRLVDTRGSNAALPNPRSANRAIHTQPEPGRIGAGVPIRNVDFSRPQIVRS